MVGLLLLFVFSIVVYKFVVFLSSLLLYFITYFLFCLVLGWFKATLTLPGIAGMVLTVGMAIDASILFMNEFEKNYVPGITIGKAVQTGFSDAMEVILDSNITTFLVGISPLLNLEQDLFKDLP